MASTIFRIYVLFLFISLCVECKSKLTESDEEILKVPEIQERKPHKMNDGAALVFADEFKQILERYLFGICPQTFKMQLNAKSRSNGTAPACDEAMATLQGATLTAKSLATRLVMQLNAKSKGNGTAPACDVDAEQQDLAARLATLSLRAHSASRGDCSRFGVALANTLGELARTAANRAAITSANNEAIKKRKLSKSQKAKIQAKQRTALAVKKKAAAAAAAAAAKMATSV